MVKKKNGIVLITIMLLMALILMVVVMLIASGRSSMLLGANFSERERALYAAESGLAYVQGCIFQNLNWTADETTLDSLYNPGFPDLSVEIVQSGGTGRCVHGSLGADLEFYVAFYEPSWDSSDIRNDKNSEPLKYYSLNNLDSSSVSETIYKKGSSYVPFTAVPPNTAHIIVEGRCKNVRRYVEAMLKLDTGELGDAGTITAGGIDVDLTNTASVFLVNTASGNEAKIRSMMDITVDSGDAKDKNCFQIANKGTSATGSGTESSPIAKYTYVNGTKIDSEQETKDYAITCDNSPQTQFLENAKIPWSDVVKKYLTSGVWTGNVKTTLAPGTWVYRNSGAAPGTYQLCYCADPFDSAAAETFVNDHAFNAYTSNLVSGDTSNIVFNPAITTANLDTEGFYMFNVKNPVGVDDGSFALLATKIDGTYKGQTYNDKSLKSILTDKDSFKYDNDTAEELVMTLLSKNSYIGEDPTGGGGGGPIQTQPLPAIIRISIRQAR